MGFAYLRKIKIVVFFGIAIFAFAFAQGVSAGFGISPPYVKTIKPIFPGSHYEQKITLLRSSAEEELQATVIVNAPDVAEWITIDRGEVFNLPKDELKIPMVVKVDVPSDAEIGNYQGYINIQVSPKGQGTGGGVAIALGARVDIDLNITNQAFFDFTVKKFDIPDFETFSKPWSWKIFSHFFYRVRTVVTIQNTGNIKVAPTKIVLEVYDLNKQNMLESSEDKKMEKVPPFTTSDIEASFPTKLAIGEYWGKIKVYKEEEIIYKDETIFHIVPPGTLEGGSRVGIWPWLMLSGLILAALMFLLLLVKIKIWRFVFIGIYYISWPLRLIVRLIISIWKKTKKRFWQKMHEKAISYQEEDNDTK